MARRVWISCSGSSTSLRRSRMLNGDSVSFPKSGYWAFAGGFRGDMPQHYSGPRPPWRLPQGAGMGPAKTKISSSMTSTLVHMVRP